MPSQLPQNKNDNKVDLTMAEKKEPIIKELEGTLELRDLESRAEVGPKG